MVESWAIIKMAKVKTENNNLTISPLLVSSDIAAQMLGISKEYFRQLDRAGKVPASLRGFGKRRLWLVSELNSWCSAGCPSRETWLKIKDGK